MRDNPSQNEKSVILLIIEWREREQGLCDGDGVDYVISRFRVQLERRARQKTKFWSVERLKFLFFEKFKNQHSMQRQKIRTYVLASTGILLIGVSLGMLWYWSLDEEDSMVRKTDEKTSEKATRKKTE